MYDLLDNIDVKIRQLAAKLEQSERANATLERENRKLNADLEQQSDRIKVLKTKLEQNRQLIESEVQGKPEVQNAELRKQLDAYIKELDQVMEWLQKS